MKKLYYKGDIIEIDYFVEYKDGLDYLEHWGYGSNKRSGQHYILTPTDEVYNTLKIGDYIGVETEPNKEMVGFSHVEKKYKNGRVLVYEA